jgi:thiamine biosynthesis lipoprotein
MTGRSVATAFVLGVFGLPAAGLGPTAARAPEQALAVAQRTELVERRAYLMGTRVHLAIWSGSRGAGHAQLERALQALEQTDADLSTWRDDSAISRLNRARSGVAQTLGPELCSLFGVLAHWRAVSGGAFDPAIGALSDAWGLHDAGRIPSSGALARARRASGFEKLAFDGSNCTATRQPGVSIDVGAFGKGEALDRAARVIGDGRWMIDLGGQVSVGGTQPGQEGWPLSIAHAVDRATPYLSVVLREGSLSTSGGSERDLIVGGRRVSHHLDPRSGRPAAFSGSVSVWHGRALEADILSTALFVMGPRDGLRWAEDRGLAACYLELDAGGRLRPAMTKAFRRLMT